MLDERPGGMGGVLICEHIEVPGLEVALKGIPRPLVLEPRANHAFVREALISSRLVGVPFVLAACGVDVCDGQLFVMMPVVPPGPNGEITLQDLIGSGQLVPPRALAIAWQVATGMMCAAERLPGLVHSDLKPSNVLVAPAGAFVSDFGIARVAGELAPEAGPIGTPGYAAPETYDGELSVASDVYSFGVMLSQIVEKPLLRASEVESGPPEAASGEALRFLVELALAKDLLTLAGRCQADDVAMRTADFFAVRAQLDDAAARAGIDTTALQAAMNPIPDLRNRLMPATVETLLRFDEIELALDELDSVPDEHQTSTLRMLHGSALSQAGRDADALTSYDAGLALAQTDAERNECLGEMALSLKRLGRRDEAIPILRDLVRRTGSEHQIRHITNLAGAHIENGEVEQAIGLLRGFTRANPTHPQVHKLWIQLGIGLRRQGEAEQAIDALRHAVRREPADSHAHAVLAEVLFDDLGRVPEAAASAVLAIRAGDASTGTLFLAMQCAQALEDADGMNRLTTLALAHHDARIVADMRHHAEAGTRPGPRAASLAGGQEDETTALDELATRSVDDETTALSQPQDCGVSEQDRHEDEISADPAGSDVMTMPNASHMQIAVAFDGFCSVDFYCDVTDDEYCAMLCDQLSAVRHELDLQQGITMRGTPWRFTVCPNCAEPILTNRREGDTFRCQRCSETVPSSPEETLAELDDLLAQVEDQTGRRRASLAGHATVLVVRADADDQVPEIVECAREAGFEVLDDIDIRVYKLAIEAFARLGLDPGQRWVGMLCRHSEDSYGVAGSTPEDVARLIAALRLRLTPMTAQPVTLSETYRVDSRDPLLLLLDGHREAAEQRLLETLSDIDSALVWDLLVTASSLAGEDEAAHRRARVLTALEPKNPRAWFHMAATDLKLNSATKGAREEWQTGLANQQFGLLRIDQSIDEATLHRAVTNLERAVGLDPTFGAAHLLLAYCKSALGDSAGASTAQAAAVALGVARDEADGAAVLPSLRALGRE